MPMKDLKFTWAYPHNGTIQYSCHESVVRMIIHELTEKERKDCLLGSSIESCSSSVCMNRNKIVDFFYNKTTDDYLMMFDTDIAFDPDILTKFATHIVKYDKEVPFWNREKHPHIISARVDIGNGMPVFYKQFGPGKYKQDPRPFTGLKQFDAVGSGIIVISRFCLGTIMAEQKSMHLFNYLVEGGASASDDFSFCFRARESGFKPYGAWDIRGWHQKTQPIQPRYFETAEEFDKFKKEQPDEVPEWLKDEAFDPNLKRQSN